MAVKITQPARNLREELNELRTPTGIAGEAMLRADTPQEQFNLIGAGRKNLIINGNHQVNQRGALPVTTITNSAYEATDRWKTQRSTVTADASLSNGYLKVQATNTTTGHCAMRQWVEDVSTVSNKDVTLSFKYSTNVNYARANVWNGSMYVGTLVLEAGVEKYVTLTTNMQSAGACMVSIGLQSAGGGTTAITSGDYVEFTDVQLELGKVATPFEHRSYGEELALCQRYYQVLDSIRKIPAIRFTVSGGNPYANMTFLTSMRTTPAFSSTGTWNSGAGYAGSPTVQEITTTGVALIGSSTFSANECGWFDNGSGEIILDAEL